jgi:hypothetical protein
MAFDLSSSLAEVERQVAPIAARHQLDDDIGVLAHAVDHLAWCVRAGGRPHHPLWLIHRPSERSSGIARRRRSGIPTRFCI